MLCTFEPEPLKVTPNSIGIDLGLNHLVVDSNGKKYANPRHTAKYAAKLVKYQRRLAKKKLGSVNRNKARAKVARIHAKISDCRMDSLHKLSRKLINENQVVCAETLRVKNMVRNRKLSKSISDASWGALARMLEYKAEWGGRSFVQIDQFFPSTKRCSHSGCGHTVDGIGLNERDWVCPKCGTTHDRDTNAAKNIKAVGHTVLAFGENVSLA